MATTARARPTAASRDLPREPAAAGVAEAPLYHDIIHTVRARRLQARTIAQGLARLRGWLRDAWHEARAGWRRAAAEREAIRQLRELDDRLLRDIGIRRDQIPEVVRALSRAPGTARPTAAVLAFPPRVHGAGGRRLDRAA